MAQVALVTAASAKDLDEDLPPLVAALAAADVSQEIAVWDDPRVDWSAFRLAVVRSTWDYVPQRDKFLAWADRVSTLTRLVNPAGILRWNTDKRYLREMSRQGVPVVETHWIEPGDPISLPYAGEFVVKPAVSAGAKDTARYRPGQTAAATEHVARLQRQGGVVMVQPYLTGLEDAGETAAIFLGGAYSHAIRKGPILKSAVEVVGGLFAKEDIRAREIRPAERALADRVLAAVPGGADRLLYARVDMAPGPSGEPVLLEFEATEPSLFFAFSAGSADRLAHAILRALNRGL
jgi:glutathione synthase/RimK-type ligase-like ATP-grasp enzyme